MADIVRKKQSKEEGKKHGLRFPDSAIEALDAKVRVIIAEAAERTVANGRKTIKAYDL